MIKEDKSAPGPCGKAEVRVHKQGSRWSWDKLTALE